MSDCTLKDFIIDACECNNIKNKVKNRLWRALKQLLWCGLVLLIIMLICFIIFKDPRINEKILNICIYINVFCIAGIFTIVIFGINSIREFKPKLFTQISSLLLTQVANLKIETFDSKDFFVDFYIDSSDDNIGDILPKINASNLKISHNKLFINDSIFSLCRAPSIVQNSYLSFNYKSQKTEIVTGKIVSHLYKLPDITLFRGIIISISKKQVFKGNLCILQKNKFGFKRKPFANIPLINVQNPLLKNYSIYSDNSSDLNKITDSQFLNSFLNLIKIFKGSKIDLGSNGDNILIIIETKQMPYEKLSLLKSIDSKQLQTICNQYSAILNFLDSIDRI